MSPNQKLINLIVDSTKTATFAGPKKDIPVAGSL